VKIPEAFNTLPQTFGLKTLSGSAAIDTGPWKFAFEVQAAAESMMLELPF
jgi:hypothetical protein